MEMLKEIKRNRDTGGYDMFLNGRYVGSRGTHRTAQIELDRLAYDALTHGASEDEL